MATAVDPAMFALPVLSTMAAAIGNSRRAKLKTSWHEPAVIWTAAVARTGDRKSPPFGLAVAPLLRHDNKAAIDHEAALLEREPLLEAWKLLRKEWRDNGGEGDFPVPPPRPRLRRFVSADATLPAIAVLLDENPRGLLMYRDELGSWIASFRRDFASGYAQGWLELYRGGVLIVDRKGAPGVKRHMRADHAAVCVCGTLQPEPLRRMLTPDLFQSGFVARLLMAAPPAQPTRWTDAELSAEALDLYGHLIDELLAMPGRDQSPIDLALSPAAADGFKEFFDHNGREKDATSTSEWMRAARAKAAGHVARFALILHLAAQVDDGEDGTAPIGEVPMRNAIELMIWFLVEQERIYASDLVGAASDDLVEWIARAGGSVTVRDTQRERSYGSADEARADLAELVRAGVGVWTSPPPGPTGGRPSERFELLGSDKTHSRATGNGGIVRGTGSVRALCARSENGPVSVGKVP